MFMSWTAVTSLLLVLSIVGITELVVYTYPAVYVVVVLFMAWEYNHKVKPLRNRKVRVGLAKLLVLVVAASIDIVLLYTAYVMFHGYIQMGDNVLVCIWALIMTATAIPLTSIFKRVEECVK